MKFAHLADVHLGYRQYGSEERALDFAQAFKKAMEFAEKQDVDFILISGDLFHKKSEMDPITLAQATVVLERVKRTVIAVEGNHDSTYFRERFSWMDYLSSQGLVINLKPSFDGSSMGVTEWDGRSGAYIDLGDARVYGLKYYGMMTEKILDAFLPEIERGGFTVFMSHFGIEGYMNIYGCISSERLYRYKERIDYVALGHIHKKYVENDFIFNPGSLESCEVNEYQFEKGIFLVKYDGELTYSHVSSFYTPRVFRIIEVDFRDYAALKDRLMKERRGRGEVIHLKVRTDRNVDREKIERVAREVLEPLVLRVEVDYSRGVLQAVNLSPSGRRGIELNVVSAILKGFGYEDISEEVLRLKELFIEGRMDAVDDIVSMIVSEKLEDAEKELKREESEQKELEDDEEEWRWWERT
ncbi:metallophosphoesterase family protein [Geoglobus sp.]